MNPTEELELRIRGLRVPNSSVVDRKILADALATLESSRRASSDARPTGVWRAIMKNKWTKLAAAILVAVTVGTVMFHRQMSAVAYALEETLEANLGLRFIHIRCEPAGNGMSEAWAQFAEDGTLLRAKMIFPKTEDGAKEVSWQQDRAEVWFKTKGHVLVLRDKKSAERISQELSALDPKSAVAHLYDAKSKGNVHIETQQPEKEGDPIRLIVTPNDSADSREIFLIDPQTKLATELQKFRRVNEKYELIGRIEFLDYNQPIPAEKFALNVPPDVTRIDWTTQEVGIPKDDLSDNEIATKVARAFFEALIAQDYATAGKMFSGMPAARLEEAFRTTEFLRIVSIGEPTPHPDARTGFLRVPCEVEIRVDGKTETKEFTPLIRALGDNSDRWSIGGGI